MFFVAEDIGQYSFIVVTIIFHKDSKKVFFSSLMFFIIPKFGMVLGLS